MILIKILLILVLVIVLLLVGLCVFMCITGRGTIKQFRDENGNVLAESIAEKTFIDVNGTENGMIIRGKSIHNPVLLFISGGPGVPQYWLNEYYKNAIEDHYTVCWWDYAGEGLSYHSSIQSDDVTMKRLEQDAITVVKYLKERFGVDKVYLMAHSGGSPLGITLAANHPDLFYCYFGMGQVVSKTQFGDRYESGYYFMKDIFEKNHNDTYLKKMNQLVNISKEGIVTPKNIKNFDGKWESILLAAGCATTREMRSDATEIFFPNIVSKCYTFKEKINYWKGKFVCAKSAYYTDYTDNGCLDLLDDSFLIPIYFIGGYYDYTCPVSQVEKFYQKIEAPDKKMVIFKDSAHSPLWEENDAVIEFMTSVTERLRELKLRLNKIGWLAIK